MSKDAPLDRPAPLAELADYQDGSIVSRTIVKDRSGTVTLFAFDAGQELSEHTAPFDALLYVADGKAAITIGDTHHELAAGEIILLPANVPHSVRAAVRFKMLLVMIRST